MSPQRKYETIQSTAVRLGVSTRSIRRWIADGTLTAYRLGGKIVRLDPDEVDDAARPIPTAGRAR